MLVRVVKNWDCPDLLRQTPARSGAWSGVRFTLEPVEECDVLLVLNEVRDELLVRCPPQNVWALMQEPFVPGVFDWMVEGHRGFARVFTHHPPRRSGRYVAAPPLVPWHVDRDFDALDGMAPPPKSADLSWITSAARDFPGHRRRMAFLEFLCDRADLPFDLFGRGIRPISDKWNGLAPYRYSLAVENCCCPDYWTEKLADCLLSFTLPFYYGCPNLECYLPAEAFVRIDIGDPQGAVRTIREAIARDEYTRRLPAICEARRRLLQQYQFFPFIAGQALASCPAGQRRRMVKLRPYRRSVRRRLLNRLWPRPE